MLKLKTTEQQVHFIAAQNSIGNYQNYLDDVLLPTVKKGNWDTLQNMVVFSGNNGQVIHFHEDKWDLNAIQDKKIDNGLSTALYFTRTESVHDNKRGEGKKLEQNICNQIKGVTLCLLYGGRSLSIDVIRQTINGLTNLAVIMLNKGCCDFCELTTELIREWAQIEPFFESSRNISHTNKLLDYAYGLPFAINFDRLTAKRLGVTSKEDNQHYAIPPRLYATLLNQFTTEINELLPHLPDIECAIEEMILLEQRFVTHQYNRVRTGVATVDQVFDTRGGGATNWPKIVMETFEQAGVDVADNYADPRWESIISGIKPNFKAPPRSYYLNWRKTPFSINGKDFNTVGDLKRHLKSVDYKCKTICLMLSGMRCDELHAMNSAFGAQVEIINGRDIHLFTTLQSKITKSSQSKDDVFVTTINGHNAFKLLDTIHTPFRKKFHANKNNLIANLSETLFPVAAKKQGWMGALRKYLNSKKCGLELELSNDDIKYLNLSNPARDTHKEGDKFHITQHQFRRSFAYYLIGFELMAFPQLKKQLSHLTMAMTLHYANHASSFQKLHSEISKERSRQQAQVLAKVYKRIANSDRIAGGKGKALQQIAGDGKNYFEIADNKRKLDPNYWQRLISDGKVHIHAIAPSMYCTNSACSMRMNIELAECVDCEFDIIENAMYAEGVRMNASKNLLLLEETGELTSNVMSQLAMKIRSSEKIMTDLDYKFEPFQFPQSVLDAQIGVINI
jgi:hypothetical protein